MKRFAMWPVRPGAIKVRFSQISTKCLVCVLMLWGCFAVSEVATAQDDEERFQMPTDPSVWLNSDPITTEMLAGKAAVLYFFEET